MHAAKTGSGPARTKATTIGILAGAWFAACGSSGSGGGSPNPGADAAVGTDAGTGLGVGTPMLDTYVEAPLACPVVVSDGACDKSLRPIVFVHGTFGSGDNISNVAQLFGSNGYCQDRFVAIDYNSLGDSASPLIDALVDKVLQATGMDKVDIMGHSQGAKQVYDYLSDATHAAKVAHYVQLAGGAKTAPPAGIPTLSLSSEDDTIFRTAGVTGAEKSISFKTQDHFAVASSTESFVAMYNYLVGRNPQYTEIQCGDEQVTVEGKVEEFGDNTIPPDGGKLEIYEMTGGPSRGNTTPLMTVSPDPADGSFKPVTLKRGARYEFKGYDGKGNVIGHQYLTPLKRSHRLLRLLVPSTGVGALVTNNVKPDDGYTVLVLRTAKGAFRHDLGDSLKINGLEVLSDAVAGVGTTTVGLYLFDANGNGSTDATPIDAFRIAPFVKGADAFIGAATPGYVEINFNGQVLHVPNWPSKSQGQTLVMFP